MKHDSRNVQKLLSQTSAWGYGLSQERAKILLGFSELLVSYGESNVIGAKTFGAIFEDHVMDSLSCLLFEPLTKATEAVDVGSGGGLPGLPLAIAVNSLKVSLVESTAKKAKFLVRATESLELADASVINARAEEVGASPSHRGRYDVATARALASLDILAEYCLPLVRVGGHVIAMKARVEADELSRGKVAAKMLGGKVSEVMPVERLPGYEQKQRHLVVFEKVSGTPQKYPRGVGIPAKKPLGQIGKR